MAEHEHTEPRETTAETHMASLPSYADATRMTGLEPDFGLPPRTPRWVKLFGSGLILLILLLVVVHLTGSGLMSHTP